MLNNSNFTGAIIRSFNVFSQRGRMPSIGVIVVDFDARECVWRFDREGGKKFAHHLRKTLASKFADIRAQLNQLSETELAQLDAIAEDFSSHQPAATKYLERPAVRSEYKIFTRFSVISDGILMDITDREDGATERFSILPYAGFKLAEDIELASNNI